MKRDEQKLVESSVVALASHMQILEAHIEKKFPDEEMRLTYRILRELKDSSILTAAEFKIIYQLLDELNDSMRITSEHFNIAIEKCFMYLSALPAVKSSPLRKMIDLVKTKRPSKYFRPYFALYSWARLVFSGPAGYSSHILASRDESVLHITIEDQYKAIQSTPLVMRQIRDSFKLTLDSGLDDLKFQAAELTHSIESIVRF